MHCHLQTRHVAHLCVLATLRLDYPATPTATFPPSRKSPFRELCAGQVQKRITTNFRVLAVCAFHNFGLGAEGGQHAKAAATVFKEGSGLMPGRLAR